MALHHKAGTVTCHYVDMHVSVKKHHLQKHLILLVYQHALQNALTQLKITWQLNYTLPTNVSFQNLLAAPTCISDHLRRPLLLPVTMAQLCCPLFPSRLPISATHAAHWCYTCCQP